MHEKISKVFENVSILLGQIKRRKWRLFTFVIIIAAIIAILYISNKISNDELGPTSQYDWAYFEKNIDIKKDNSNESIGFLRINGVVFSKGIISPAKPAEFKIFEIEFRYVQPDSLINLCEGNICKENVTVNVCLQGYNARGYNKSELVEYPYLRDEPPCIENIKLYNSNSGSYERVWYSNDKSQDLSKEVIFLTSGPQSLRIWNFFGYPYDIENVFEVNPYYFYSELQLNKYVFILTIIVVILTVIQGIDIVLKLIDRFKK